MMNMKKNMTNLLSLLLLASVGINLYLLQRDSETVINDDFDQEITIRTTNQFSDTIEVAQSAVKKNSNNTTLNVSNNASNKVSKEIAQKWLSESSDFFKNKLLLTDEQVISIHALKSGREQEFNAFIIPKINAHRKQFGTGPYLYSMVDSVFMGRLNEKYMGRLKKLIGDKNFELYEEFKNEFNRKLISINKSQNIIDF